MYILKETYPTKTYRWCLIPKDEVFRYSNIVQNYI